MVIMISSYDFIAHSDAAQYRRFSLRREEPGLQKHYLVPKMQTWVWLLSENSINSIASFLL